MKSEHNQAAVGDAELSTGQEPPSRAGAMNPGSLDSRLHGLAFTGHEPPTTIFRLVCLYVCMCVYMYEMSCQSRFDARYWMIGAGALGRPRGMEWGGRREEGSGWGTHVYLWRIHFDIWQN